MNRVISVSERMAMRTGVKMKKLAKMAEKWRWILYVMRLDNVIKNYHLGYVWRFQNSDALRISVILCEKAQNCVFLLSCWLTASYVILDLKPRPLKNITLPFTMQKWTFYAALHACFSLVSHAFASKNPCFWPIILPDIQINVNDMPSVMLLH